MRVRALPVSNLTIDSAQLNGFAVDVVADNPSVWFCWDTSDQGTATTSAWANVISVGTHGKGANVTTTLSGLSANQSYSYRLYAENSLGTAWSSTATTFQPVHLPQITNNGARVIGPGTALLQGAVLDSGSEAPEVTFHYWESGSSNTNSISAGIQVGECSVELNNLPYGQPYAYLLTAANQAGSGTTRLLYLNHEFATVSGFTFSNGYSKASARGAVAIGSEGGTLSHSRITDSLTTSTTQGIALYQEAGVVTDCVIDNNRPHNNSTSGTVLLAGGIIEKSLISNNSIINDGGGLYLTGGTARRCTIIDNTASGNGCGVYLTGEGRLEESIVWGNHHRNNPTLATRDLYGATVENALNNCSPAAAGLNGSSATPLFIDAAAGDYRQQAASPAIALGAYDFDFDAFSAGILIDQSSGLAPLAVTLTPVARGTTTDSSLLAVSWKLTRSGADAIDINYTGLASTSRTLTAGWYDVALTITDPADHSATSLTLPKVIAVSPAMLYVTAGNSAAAAPYDTPVTAAANLPEALALAADGAMITVADGTYQLERELLITRAVTIKSLNGRGAATIAGSGLVGQRVVALAQRDTLLSGFTITGGYGNYATHGGGVLVAVDGGTLYNCAIINNRTRGSGSHGGGVRLDAGRLSNSIVSDNKVDDSAYGVGIFQSGGIVENSLIISNRMSASGPRGGGIYLSGSSAVVRNCTIVHNYASRGGGIFRFDGTVQNSILVNNDSTDDRDVGGGDWEGQSATAWQFNCTPVAAGTGTVTADPLFVRPALGDYRLKMRSPCINAGLNLVGLPEEDLAGNPRIQNGIIDIGAYETYVADGTILILR